MAAIALTAETTCSNTKTITGSPGSLQSISAPTFTPAAAAAQDTSSASTLRVEASATAGANPDGIGGSPLSGLWVSIQTGPTATGPWTELGSHGFSGEAAIARHRFVLTGLDLFTRAVWTRASRSLPPVTVACAGDAI